jgi:serine/threonine protein kinase
MRDWQPIGMFPFLANPHVDHWWSFLQLARLEAVHSHNFIHGDIKPNNVIVGDDDTMDTLHLVDFGITHRYRDARTHIHIPFHEGLPFVGTPAFASVNSHLGRELGRRDDLESLAYLLLYLLRGSLPWFDGAPIRKSAILEMKQNISLDELCKSFPEVFSKFLEYSRSLSFTDKPNYGLFRLLFRDIQEASPDQFTWQATGRPLDMLCPAHRVTPKTRAKATRLDDCTMTMLKTPKR